MTWQNILKDNSMAIDSGFGKVWEVFHMDTYKLQGAPSYYNYAGLYSDIQFVFAQRDGDTLGNKSDTFSGKDFSQYYAPVVAVDFMKSEMKPSQLFMMTQNIDKPWQKRFPEGINDLTVGEVDVEHFGQNQLRSTMVGDIFNDLERDAYWFVSNQGFKKFTFGEPNKEKGKKPNPVVGKDKKAFERREDKGWY